MNLNGQAGNPITIESSGVISPSISDDADNIKLKKHFITSFSDTKLILESYKHHNNNVVFLILPKDAELIAAFKTLGVARWSQTKRKWFIAKDRFELNKLTIALKEKAVIDTSGLKENTNTQLPNEIEQSLSKLKLWMEHKLYSACTINTYL